MKKASNKLLVFLATLIVFILFIPSPALAHVLKADSTIGAVLHIDPEDDPIANQQTGFFFEFKDTQNKFDPINCNCTFSITQAGQQIYNQPLFQDSSSLNAAVFYTFPQKDVYQVIVSGSPKTAGGFSDFKLTFDVRVARGENQTQAETKTDAVTPNWITTYTILILAGIVVFFGIMMAIKRKV